MRLSHLHLPNPIPYAHSLRLQEAVLERQFTYNTSLLQSKSSLSPLDPTLSPQPTLLTFQTRPTYTVGRRHLKSNPLSDSQIHFLTSNNLASFHASPRGGLLTYHAPGQLTGYLIYNLRQHNITPRCHVRLLEESVIRTAARYSVQTTTTTDPGVWVKDPNGQTSDRKLCAIGVHVVRGTTSHGVGLNIFDSQIESQEKREMYKLPLSHKAEGKGGESMQDSNKLAEGYLSWGFSRIVACGLEGKSVTWLTTEGADRKTATIENVADTLAIEICKELSSKGKIAVGGTDKITESDVLERSEGGVVDILTGEKVEGMKGGLNDWVDMLKGGKMIFDHAMNNDNHKDKKDKGK